MKKYLSSLIWKPVALTGAALMALFLLTLLFWPPVVAIVGVLVVLALVAGYFLLNRHCQNLCKVTAPTSYFQDLRWRNMPAIVTGSTRAWESFKEEQDEYYYAAGFRRSNAMVFHMLRTYFSHVKEGGTVYYVVDPAENAEIGSYISPADFHHIHPHVFLKMGVATPKPEQKTNPLVFDRQFALQFAWRNLLKKMGLTKNAAWNVSGKSLSNTDALLKELCDVVRFCAERDLKCNMIFLNNYEAFDSKLKAFASKHEYAFTSVAAASSKELRECLT